MPRVKRSREAKADVARIWRYLAERNFGAAERWLSTIDAKVKLLAEFPGIGQRREELAPALQSFPVGDYLIFYRRAPSGIEILRVLHGVRRPAQLLRALSVEHVRSRPSKDNLRHDHLRDTHRVRYQAIWDQVDVLAQVCRVRSTLRTDSFTLCRKAEDADRA